MFRKTVSSRRSSCLNAEFRYVMCCWWTKWAFEIENVGCGCKFTSPSQLISPVSGHWSPDANDDHGWPLQSSWGWENRRQSETIKPGKNALKEKKLVETKFLDKSFLLGKPTTCFTCVCVAPWCLFLCRVLVTTDWWWGFGGPQSNEHVNISTHCEIGQSAV